MQKYNEDLTDDHEQLIIDKAPKTWARETFSGAYLGDKRRTARLIDIATNTMQSPGESFLAACNGDKAQIEGTYRWLENDDVDPAAVLEAGCLSSKRYVDDVEGDILAIGDTSKLEYKHSLRTELGPLGHGSKKGNGKRGMLVHSTIFQSAHTGECLGLGDQVYWKRDDKQQGKKHKRKQLDYHQKESFKWEYAIDRVTQRFPDDIKRLIFVSDRESDIYELLMYLIGNELRYIVRASWNRKLSDDEQKLFEKMSSAPAKGEVIINVPQKGGRTQRRARVRLRACTLSASPPGDDKVSPSLTMNVVQAQEVAAEEPMSWTLLTSEPIDTFDQVLNVVRSYGLRWRIEDFHRCWKTGGTNVEDLRLQSQEAMMRAAIVLAIVATRLTQLRDEANPELITDRTQMQILADYTREDTETSGRGVAIELEVPERPCTSILSDLEWRVLWLNIEKGKPLPPEPPNRRWAYRAIGHLGGWADTKRTGRVGMKALWRGYSRLQDLAQAVGLAQQAGMIV